MGSLMLVACIERKSYNLFLCLMKFPYVEPDTMFSNLESSFRITSIGTV